MPFSRILVGIDFAPESNDALRGAGEWARRDRAALHVVHVLPHAAGEYPLVSGAAAVEASRMELRSRVEAELRQRVRDLTGGVEAQAHVVDGQAYAEIVRLADAISADLVVVGSLGRTGIKRILLGSVAERVARTASCSVLVWRDGPAGGPVLAATDLAGTPQQQVRTAAEIARSTGRTMAVIHCIEPEAILASAEVGPTPRSMVSAAEDRAKRQAAAESELRGALASAGAEGSVHVEVGSPAGAILRLADRLGVGCIVVGTAGRTGLPRLLLGSTAESVLRSAACPVLVVRHRS